MAAAKDWYDNIANDQDRTYQKLYADLLDRGSPHIEQLETADRKAVLDSIADKSGKYADEMDKNMLYIHQEAENIKVPPVVVSDEARKAMKDYYKSAEKMCDAQADLMRNTQVLQQKLNDDTTFLEILRHMQLPLIQVTVRTKQQEESLQGKKYSKLAQTPPRQEEAVTSIQNNTTNGCFYVLCFV